MHVARALICSLGSYRAVIFYCEDGKTEEKAGILRKQKENYTSYGMTVNHFINYKMILGLTYNKKLLGLGLLFAYDCDGPGLEWVSCQGLKCCYQDFISFSPFLGSASHLAISLLKSYIGKWTPASPTAYTVLTDNNFRRGQNFSS